MKKRLPSFLSGMLTMALICAFVIPVLASAGMTITVDPINIQVKGQVFQPKDVNGNDVPVFAYNGTTYAPLRALATAYGLEVGYDGSTNMATVSEPGVSIPAAPSDGYSNWSAEEEAAYQEFKGMWEIVGKDTGFAYVDYIYNGELNEEELRSFLSNVGKDTAFIYSERMILDFISEYQVTKRFVSASYFYDIAAYQLYDKYFTDETTLWFANYSIDKLDSSSFWNVD